MSNKSSPAAMVDSHLKSVAVVAGELTVALAVTFVALLSTSSVGGYLLLFFLSRLGW